MLNCVICRVCYLPCEDDLDPLCKVCLYLWTSPEEKCEYCCCGARATDTQPHTLGSTAGAVNNPRSTPAASIFLQNRDPLHTGTEFKDVCNNLTEFTCAVPQQSGADLPGFLLHQLTLHLVSWEFAAYCIGGRLQISRTGGGVRAAPPASSYSCLLLLNSHLSSFWTLLISSLSPDLKAPPFLSSDLESAVACCWSNTVLSWSAQRYPHRSLYKLLSRLLVCQYPPHLGCTAPPRL